MPETTIFDESGTTLDCKVKVVHDTDDDYLPIAISPADTDDGRYWLKEDEAVKLAKAILDALGEAEPEVVRASDISFNEGVVRLAAAHGRTVTFSYAKGDGSIIEPRHFAPEKVEVSKDGVKRFVGPDPDREGEYRSYRIDRMKGEVSVA